MAYNENRLAGPPQAHGVFLNGYWWYDTLDALATIEGAGYFSNGQTLGMKPGDKIIVTIWTTAIPNPITGIDGVATPLTGSGSIAVVAEYRVRGLTTGGAAVITNELTQTLVAA